MKIRLTQYLDRVETKYKEARKDWERIQKKLEAEESRYNAIEWIYLTPEGKTAEHNKHESNKLAIYRELEGVRENFSKAIESIIEDSDKVFDKAFRFTPENVDQNGVAILQNGALSIHELMELAEKYRQSGNYTMYFMVAEKLNRESPANNNSKEETEGHAYYVKARERRNNREDHELLKGFGEACLYGLRDEKFLADGTHGIHEESYNRYKEVCEDIVSSVSSPWD